MRCAIKKSVGYPVHRPILKFVDRKGFSNELDVLPGSGSGPKGLLLFLGLGLVLESRWWGARESLSDSVVSSSEEESSCSSSISVPDAGTRLGSSSSLSSTPGCVLTSASHPGVEGRFSVAGRGKGTDEVRDE